MSASESSSGSELEESEGASTGKRGLPSCPGGRDHLTVRGDRDSQSSSELSGDDREGNGDLSTSGVGSPSSSVIVAQPPRGSGNDSSLQEVVLTGSEALDVLDQVSERGRREIIKLCPFLIMYNNVYRPNRGMYFMCLT